MTRLLFLGDSAGTGFGTVTKELGTALLARGMDVRFMSLNESTIEDVEPFKGRTAALGVQGGWLAGDWLDAARQAIATNQRLPAERETIIRRTIARAEGMFTGGLFDDGWTPDCALLLGDMGSVKVSPVLRLLPPDFPIFHYVPIEGIWLPPAWGDVWRILRPVAMCEFGADQIAEVTGRRPPVIFHGVNTDEFYPVSPMRRIVMPTSKSIITLRSKAECRKFLGWPQNAFIMFRADRHMPRKDYPALFRAVVPFLARHREAFLVIHAHLRDEGGDFFDDVSHYPAAKQQILFSSSAGQATTRLLNVMYNAADLYVSNSAEGFGLTIAEALAAGTPALGLRYSSVPEVIGDAGWTVPAANPVDNIYSYLWAHVDEGAYTATLEDVYSKRNELPLRGDKGPPHVREHFTWARAAEQFHTLAEAAVPEREAVAV